MGHMPSVDQYDLMAEKIRAYWIQEFPDTPFPEVFLAAGFEDSSNRYLFPSHQARKDKKRRTRNPSPNLLQSKD